jgi:hypothetical protein
MPGWVGTGVEIPLPAEDVGVGFVREMVVGLGVAIVSFVEVCNQALVLLGETCTQYEYPFL